MKTFNVNKDRVSKIPKFIKLLQFPPFSGPGEKIWHRIGFHGDVRQYDVFGRFKRGARWVFDQSLASMWQLHQLHPCLPLPAAPHPDRPHALKRQTLFRCSLNSATPLALCLYASCTQTLNKVNQRSRVNAKAWAGGECCRHISVWISSPKHIRQKNALAFLTVKKKIKLVGHGGFFFATEIYIIHTLKYKIPTKLMCTFLKIS